MFTTKEPFLQQAALAVDADLGEWPILEAFYGHWRMSRGDLFAPSLKAFNLPALSFSVIPNLLVLDRLAASQDFCVRFWGTRLVRVYGQELTGERINADCAPAYMLECWKQCLAASDSKTAMAQVQRHSLNNGEVLDFARLCAPLSTDGRLVDQMVVCNDFGLNQKKIAQLFEDNSDRT